MIRRGVALSALALTGAALAASPAAASQSNELVMEDPKYILNPTLINEVAPDWKEQGVDRVRILVIWGAVSPDRRALRRPAGFSVANPGPSRSQAVPPIRTGSGNTARTAVSGGGTTAPGGTTYPPTSTPAGGNTTAPNQRPAYNWTAIDTAVDAVRRNGMRPMLTLTFTGPRWASRNPRLNRDGAYDPDPRLFAQFAGAVARRYRSKVDMYLLGNEANQRLFLTPQLNCARRTRGKCEIVAPHLYRELVRRAYPTMKRNDRSSRVLIGELAPIGSNRQNNQASLKPLPFMREFACVDEEYKPVRTGRCRGFRPARGDGFAYHPYAIKDPPDRPQRDLELFKMGDIDRMVAFLDKLTRARRVIAPGGRFNVWITEYGVESNPPDRRNGVSQLRQSRFLQQAAYIAWANPRVRSHAQYIWQDDPVQPRFGGFQSGLYFLRRGNRPLRPKLALRHFPNPFFIDTKVRTREPSPELDRLDLPRPLIRVLDRENARFWGQVRPGGATTVTLFENGRRIAGRRTNVKGFWSLTREAVRGRTYHFEYRMGGKRIQSDKLRVS